MFDDQVVHKKTGPDTTKLTTLDTRPWLDSKVSITNSIFVVVEVSKRIFQVSLWPLRCCHVLSRTYEFHNLDWNTRGRRQRFQVSFLETFSCFDR